ncbi:hypothetical protein DSECCO2_493080 [anaerobic digester metagenome]
MIINLSFNASLSLTIFVLSFINTTRLIIVKMPKPIPIKISLSILMMISLLLLSYFHTAAVRLNTR